MQNKLAVPVHAKPLVLRLAAKVSTTYSEHIKMQQIQSQTMSHDIQYSCTHTYKKKKKHQWRENVHVCVYTFLLMVLNFT